MRSFVIGSAVLLVGIGIAGANAYAGNVHLKRKPPVSVDDEGLFVEVDGCLTGLGNGDILVTLDGSAEGDTICKNPGNGNEVPGQNPGEEIDVVGEVEIPDEEFDNGNVCFSVETAVPDAPTADEAGCPGDNWETRYSDIDFFDLDLIVFQDADGDGFYESNERVLTTDLL